MSRAPGSAVPGNPGPPGGGVGPGFLEAEVHALQVRTAASPATQSGHLPRQLRVASRADPPGPARDLSRRVTIEHAPGGGCARAGDLAVRDRGVGAERHHDHVGQRPGPAAADSTPRPSFICRQPRTSISNPRRQLRRRPSITESPSASGRAGIGPASSAGSACTPPQAASAAGAAAPTAAASAPTIAARSGLPLVRVRILLSGGAGPVVGPDAPSPGLEAVRPGGELRLLCGRQPALLPPARGLTLANQAGAVLVHRTEDERRRKWIVGVTVAIDLGVLGLFKYYGFFVDEIGAFLDALGLGMPLPLLTLALPIGLSFITFQAISYTVDVKRRLLPPASLIDFALYLSFFPHVVAGPIVRAREFIPQLSRPRDPARRGGRRRRGPDRARPDQEGGAGRLPGARGRGPGVRRARGVLGPTWRSPPTHTRLRSTATSPATPTSRSAWPC